MAHGNAGATLNQHEFLKEVTFRIFGSLEIKESFRNVYEYLKLHFPLNEMTLVILDPSHSALRLIAYAGRDAGDPPDEIIPLPESVFAEVSVRKPCEPFIVGPDDQDIVTRVASPQFKHEEKTALVVPLLIKGSSVGGLVLHARGERMYSRKHVQLLASVAQPFAISLANALAHEAVVRYRDTLLDDNRFLTRELHAQSGDEIVGGSTGLRNVMEMVRQVAQLDNTVLLLGETGTGKEVIANAIHFASPRKDGPYIKINCGAIPEHLIDSELFGHERGAFTGASASYRGRFERAQGGTLFLDEIGELPLAAQVRLLRVLQNHQVERVGGSHSISVDVRVLAATHRNLRNMIVEGTFRKDLWFRLNTFPITIPPLRQRKEDIPALVRHILAIKIRELGIASPPSVATGAWGRLMEHNWPGNVRELENVVERELIRHRGGPLMFDSVVSAEAQGTAPAVHQVGTDVPLTLEEAMAGHLKKVLKRTKGKIYGPGGAAELLEMNPTTLRWRLDRLGIPYRRRDRAGR